MKSNKKKKEHLDGIIYKFTNKINGKIYIGQTVDEKRRLSEHKRCSKKKGNPSFHKAIEKYGWDNFEYKILFKGHCNNEQDLINTLNFKEIISIKYFDSYNKKKSYNLTFGGGGQLGFKLTEETKQKISDSRKGEKNPMFGKRGKDSPNYGKTKTLSLETKQKISESLKGEKNPFYGKHHTDETKKKISDSVKKTLSNPAIKEKISNSLKLAFSKSKVKKSDSKKGERNRNFGKHHSEETKQKLRLINSKAVIQLSTNDEVINEYPSLIEANKFFGKSKTNCSISKCCNGLKDTAFGYKWKWASK